MRSPRGSASSNRSAIERASTAAASGWAAGSAGSAMPAATVSISSSNRASSAVTRSSAAHASTAGCRPPSSSTQPASLDHQGAPSPIVFRPKRARRACTWSCEVSIHSPPASTHRPSGKVRVRTRPPGREEASTRTTSAPASRRSSAHERPAMPAPTITTSAMSAHCIGAAASNDVLTHRLANPYHGRVVAHPPVPPGGSVARIRSCPDASPCSVGPGGRPGDHGDVRHPSPCGRTDRGHRRGGARHPRSDRVGRRPRRDHRGAGRAVPLLRLHRAQPGSRGLPEHARRGAAPSPCWSSSAR